VRSLKVTEANRAWGRNYSREFRAWIKRHGFDKMPAATRSVAVELHEHAEAITSWRDGCQSDKGDGSFTRYRSQDAGEPLSARQRQVPTTGPTARRPASVGSFLCLHEGIAGG
jgi:hypothetical protein